MRVLPLAQSPFDISDTPFLDDTQEPIPLDLINLAQELPDGSALYNINSGVLGQTDGEDSDVNSDPAFFDNLADKSDSLHGLAATLIQSIADDKLSRMDWENTFETGLKYLGIKLEEFRTIPFASACAAFDSTLLSALVNYYCVARAEILPATGPVSTEINGFSTPETEDEADRVAAFMNFYLTKIDKGYYPDFERLLMYVGLCGSGFKKVYQDSILGRPLARFINPLDLIINVHTTSILGSTRITEVQYLTRKEVLLKQQSGYFIKFDLPVNANENSADIDDARKTINNLDGIKKSESSENKSLFKFYEVHADLAPDEITDELVTDEEMLPRPYIITICEVTRSVVAIRRNWKEGDEKYNRLEYYVNYYYLAGFGIYGMGLIHLVGSNAITMTNVLRQSIDAGMLKNIPGGVMQKGLRNEQNDNPIGPGEFRELETNGIPLSDCFMALPFAEPSATLIDLRQQLRDETQALAATAANQIPDIGANAPVGTTLAMLEVSNRVQSTVLRSLHTSLGHELQLLFNLFGEHLSDEPYPFAIPGKELEIMKKDFSDKIHITPVSDPNMLTSTHRLLKTESELRLAQSAPELHDMREFYARIYKAMGMDNEEIDKLLPPTPEPQSLDAVSENMLVMNGKPIIVATFQDDDAHNASHQPFAQECLQQGNLKAYAEITLHSQNHKALKAWKELQRKQKLVEYEQQALMKISHGLITADQALEEIKAGVANMKFPPLEPEELEKVIALPEVQNMVAQWDAEEAMQRQQQQQAEAAEQIDPNKVMIADIEQRREAAHLKADADKLKVEGEAFKAELKHEAEMSKVDSQVAIAADKHEIDLAIAQSKNLI